MRLQRLTPRLLACALFALATLGAAFAQTTGLPSETPQKFTPTYEGFDYTRRAMPFNAPQSLSPDQVYAVTAFVLHLNGVLPADATLDADSLRQVRMPNRDGFRPVTGPAGRG